MTEFQDRILVVDDETSLLTLLEGVLSLEGFGVETAASGEAAVERIGTRRFDLVLMDNNMPGLSGLEVLDHLRRTHPELPVIIMTAYGSMEVSMRAHELGAAGYLLKPFEDIGEIAREVRRVLARSRREPPEPRQLARAGL